MSIEQNQDLQDQQQTQVLNQNQVEVELDLEEKKQTIKEIKKLDYSFFTEEQKNYLDLIQKYSGRTSKIQIIEAKDLPQKKTTYIRENLAFLSVDEQVTYNDTQRFLQQDYTYAFGISMGISLASFGYFIVTTPLSKSLSKQGLKSLAFGGFGGWLYYKYKYAIFNDEITEIYTKILQRKRKYEL